MYSCILSHTPLYISKVMVKNVLSLEEGTEALQTHGGRVCNMSGGDDERGVGMSWMPYGHASYVSDKVEVLV